MIPKTTSKGTLHLSPSSLDSTPYGEVGLPAEMTLEWPNEEEPRLPPCQPWEGATWIAEALIQPVLEVAAAPSCLAAAS